jgi:hypothetical protein
MTLRSGLLARAGIILENHAAPAGLALAPGGALTARRRYFDCAREADKGAVP